MKQPRKRIVIGVMIPAVMALIVLRRTMGLPSMNGVAMPQLSRALLVTGMLIGIAIAQGISAFRRPS